MEERGPSSTGLAPNIAAGLAVLLGIIGGIVFYIIEKQDRFVRFWAMQSIILNVVWIVAYIVLQIVGLILGLIPRIGGVFSAIICILALVVLLGGFVAWVICLIQSFSGKMYKLPYIGDMAERYIS